MSEEPLEREIRTYFDGPAGYGMTPETRDIISRELAELVGERAAREGRTSAPDAVRTRMRRTTADK